MTVEPSYRSTSLVSSDASIWHAANVPAAEPATADSIQMNSLAINHLQLARPVLVQCPLAIGRGLPAGRQRLLAEPDRIARQQAQEDPPEQATGERRRVGAGYRLIPA